jgi:hypothetical protein
MTMTTHRTRQVLTPDEADVRLVEIDKGQQLADHPSAEALARARRILIGEMTLEETRAEIIAKYSE